MNPAHWYRKCPTCTGSFGRGKGANGLARHACDDVATIELRRAAKAIAAARKILRSDKTTIYDAFNAIDDAYKALDWRNR